MTGGGAEQLRWKENGAAGQHGDKMFQEAAQFRGPGREPVSRCVFAAWERVGEGEGVGVMRLFSSQSSDLQAFDNASILEGALGVHGHVAQSSAVSAPLLPPIVCAPFPSASGENLCLLAQEPRALAAAGAAIGERSVEPQTVSLESEAANTCFTTHGAAATASF